MKLAELMKIYSNCRLAKQLPPEVFQEIYTQQNQDPCKGCMFNPCGVIIKKETSHKI